MKFWKSIYFVLTLFVVVSASADETPEGKLLAVGDPAPALQFAQVLKGKEIRTFEKGRVYVVELWSIGCPPCIAGIPKMTRLAKRFADKVDVIAVDVWDRAEGNQKGVAKL